MTIAVTAYDDDTRVKNTRGGHPGRGGRGSCGGTRKRDGRGPRR